MKASDHFSGVASAYALRRPSYPDELFAYLAGLTEQHELAWDCAAGSGQASVPLARHFQKVIATDLSSAMLAQAPRHPAIEYRVALADASGIEPECVDLVTVAQALHWLQQDAFYREVDRVLKPGGALAVWTYGKQVLDDPELNQLVEGFYTDVVGPFWTPERRHVESGYSTLDFPYAELKAPEFHMRQEWSLDELLGYISTWSATQLFKQARGVDPLIELAPVLRARWGKDRERPVRWPLSMRVGIKPG